MDATNWSELRLSESDSSSIGASTAVRQGPLDHLTIHLQLAVGRGRLNLALDDTDTVYGGRAQPHCICLYQKHCSLLKSLFSSQFR